MVSTDQPIRVLMINYKMQCAGIESFIMNMYRNMDRSKVQFDFLVHYKAPQFYDEEIRQLGGKIYRLSVREDNNFLKYFQELKLFFREHPEYKIVHGHMESFGVFYLNAAKKANVPVRIAHSHIAQRNRGIKGTLKYMMNRFFSLYATDLFACSDVAGRFVFGNNTDYTVYNNAIDTQKFLFSEKVREEMRKELNIESDQFVLGHVGRFNTQKNHNFLIDIFAEIHKRNSKAVLLLIGEGNLQGKIAEKVRYLGLDEYVKFLGLRSDVNYIYQAMDVFVMPSLFEGLPVSGIEAQAAGLKCVFSDTVTRQTDLTGNAEFLSLEKSPVEWADFLLQYSKGYVRKDASAQIVDAGYDIKIQARKLQDFYLEKIIQINEYEII